MSTEATPNEGGQGAEAPPPDAGQVQESPFGDLGEDLRGFVENKKWSAPKDVVEAYKHLEGFHGVPAERLIKLPTDPTEMGEVWNRLGRPEAAEGYTLKLGEDLKDGVYDEMATAAHEAGLSDGQFGAMQERFEAVVNRLEEERVTQVAADLETWKASNGADFDNVRNLMRAVGITQDEMGAAMAGDSAAFYGTLAKVAKRMGEQPAPGSESEGNPAFRMSPEAARAKIAEMNADPAFLARLDSDDAKVRMKAAEERRKYYELANADGQARDTEMDDLRAEVQRLRAKARGSY